MSIRAQTNRLRDQARSRNLVRLSKKTGVSYSWLTKFVDGRIQNPTVGNLEKLEKAFSVDEAQQ
jgi:transcriptional regulator with XRE-family HTH domain